MKFTRLRLLGFKSFVEPSEFVIENGLTGVVGPNGCGKSNLVEAIRWVMGENSYKNMRASGMDDVIFSGSGNRASRNTAEVGLYLDNSDRTAPAIFNNSDEIQITRRIEREAGSVYRINGREARAKDVQLLFADASTGARSPSMVGQGRIGELIQAKPQARRQLLEEAAGISGLHSRRHEAELRLRAAETNLERLDDVTSQLQGQIDSLKRQARQATRFKALSADIRKGEAILLHVRWVREKVGEAEAGSTLARSTNTVAEKAQAQMEAAKAQAIAAHRLPELREADARTAAALQRLQIAQTQMEEEAERLQRHRGELDARLSQLTRDIEREGRLVADNAASLERLDAEETDLENALSSGEDNAAESGKAHETAFLKLTESERISQALTAERAEAAAGRAQLERAVKELTTRRERLARQFVDVERALSDIAGRIAALADPAEKQRAMEDCQAEIDGITARIAMLEEKLNHARAAEAASRDPFDAARTALAAVETEARTIRKMLNTGGEGCRDDLFAAVVESVTVDRGFETALGAALGDDLDQPTDVAAPAHWRHVAGAADDPALPEGVSPLIRHVDAPEVLLRRLRQTGIVDPVEAPLLQQRLRPGQRLVSKDGAMWRWDGFVAGADAPSPAALRLAQKNRLRELDAEAMQAGDILATAEANHERAAQDVREKTDQLRQARESERIASRALDDARRALAAAERASGELGNRQAVLVQSRDQTAASMDEVSSELAAAKAGLAGTADITAVETRLRAANETVAADRARVTETRALNEGLMRENESRRRRLAAIAVERTTWLERTKGADGHIADLKARFEEARAQASAAAETPDDLAARRRALMSQLNEAEALKRAAADRLAQTDSRQRETDKAAAEALTALSAAREERGRAEERLAAATERRAEIETRMRDTLHCAPHEAIRLTGLVHAAPLPEPEATERELERLKIERERLGAVNLRAEDEVRELSERHDGLTAERDDVIEAVRKLRGAIQSLNREGRERLVAAFDVVNDQFRRLFTHLFGGGTAELQFIESDDPLDAGLEILARPPGKKPQTMTLLSGGEQALTAMALIFAVFLTNPAPICVLDEVDAPLDDHNVERFCNLMDEMAASTDTRFILITHNPITMARMDRLFGVTMAEQGVSQLVSVDLQSAEQMREAV